MSSKVFNIVVVATVVLVVWAVWLAMQSKEASFEFVRGEQLVEEIDTTRLTKIEVKKGKDTVVLERRGTDFLVVSRDSYPADGGRINNLIQQCTGIVCDREIADSKDVHDELGVAEGSEDATVIRFFAEEEELVGVVVGKVEGSANYVRLSNSDKVFLSKSSVFPDTDALSYVNKDLTKIENIQKVECSGGDKPYTVLKDGEVGKLQGVPEGKVVRANTDNAVFDAARSLTFSDFRSEKAMEDLKFTHKYLVTTEHGAQYELNLGKKDEDWWVKATARYVGPSVTVKDVQALKGKDNEDAELKKKEAQLQAQTRVNLFKTRHLSWVYKLGEFSARNLTQDFANIVEEDKVFLRMSDELLEGVTVAQGKDSYTLFSPNKGVIRVKDLPEGKEEKPFVPSGIYGAATTLEWMERIDPEEEIVKDVKYTSVYTANFKGKATFRFEIGKKDGRYFVKASAEFKGDPKDNSPEAVIANGKVATFKKRHEGHVYEVAAGGPVENMIKSSQDVLKSASETPKEIAASHILISYKGATKSTSKLSKEEAKKKAEELLPKVKANPGDFAKFAEENSDGPTKTAGGDLGRFDQNKMAPPFTKAAFALKIGEVSGVVETEFGFHIIRRTQ